MGQKGSKLDVEESCLKPHHPHKCTDVDLKKLKALIKQGKLAPCFPPEEEENDELEECPICFLAYPALNNTRCCRKGICTECFLQVKLPNGHRGGALCPFCKSEFSVFFKGPRTDEERQESQAEEKRVAEATIRARQAEEARGEARASKLRQERLENSPQASSKALAQREGSDAAAMPSPSAPSAPSNPVRPRGHIDEEALRAVLASLDMSEYIPHQIRSPTTSDLEDAMLQQAIQASLRDQEFPEFSFGSMQSGVLPDAVAFSPQPSQGLPPQEEAEREDSSTGASGRHAEGGEVWEEVDLGQRRPSSRLAQSSVPLAATSNPQLSFEEEASSSGLAEQATPRAQAENSEGPSEQGVVERSNGAAVGVTEGSPKQPTPSPHSTRTPGFNALSTISSCTMETLLFDQQDNLLDTRLLDTRASMGDLLATPSSPSYPCQQLLPTPAAEAAPQALPVAATASMAAPSDKPAGGIADDVLPEVAAPASARAEGEGEPGVSSSPRKPEAAEESAHATQEGGLPACSSREVSGAEGRVQLGITAEESSAEIPAVPEPHAATESAGAAAEAAKSPSSETATSRKAAEAEEVVHEIAEVSEATPPPTLAEPAAAVESSGTKSEDVQSFAPSTTAASPCHSSDTAATAEPAMIPAESAEEAGPSPGESGIAEAAGGVQEEGVGSASQVHVDGSRGWSSRRSSASSLEERGVDTPRPEGESDAPASWRRRSRHGGARSGVHRLAQSCEPQAGLGALAAAEDGVSGLTIECSNEQEGEPDAPRTPRDMGLRRHSSGASSNDELIGALHSYAASPGASERSPLPAPPKHLKAFLSGGKRFASPLSARGRALASSPKDDPKGPSFADLLNSKGRSSNRSLSARRAREKSSVFAPPSALTVGVALVDSQPSEGLAGATAGAEAPLPNGGAAGEATASGAGGSLSAQRTLAYGEPSGQTAQGRVIYEEPGSSGALALARDGGAVLLTQPDGSTQLVLLTPDQQRQVAAAEAWKAETPAPEAQTYLAPGDPLDLQMRERLDKADAAMRQLYLTLQAGNAAASGSANAEMGGSSTVVDSFTEKLREQDERFRAAMEGMAAETGIREAPDRDAADDALKALIDKQDRLQASH